MSLAINVICQDRPGMLRDIAGTVLDADVVKAFINALG